MEVLRCAIAQHLYLNMPRLLNALFNIDASVTKGAASLRYRFHQLLIELLGIIDLGHPAPAAASCGLDHYGVADRAGSLCEHWSISACLIVAAGNDRNTGLHRALPGASLLGH